MKIAVSSRGAGLGAWIEPNLSACGFLMIVDDHLKFSAIEKKGNATDMINQAIGEGIEALISGTIEDEIIENLKNKGIKIFSAQKGSILELVEMGFAGELPNL
jgi:predicted Fe-Mo cluster-binding NifX family protein